MGNRWKHSWGQLTIQDEFREVKLNIKRTRWETNKIKQEVAAHDTHKCRLDAENAGKRAILIIEQEQN